MDMILEQIALNFTQDLHDSTNSILRSMSPELKWKRSHLDNLVEFLDSFGLHLGKRYGSEEEIGYSVFDPASACVA